MLIQNELEGQFFSQPDPKSQTLPAGGGSVTVAIVDSGVDPAIADLQPYLWRKSGAGAGSCVDQFGPAGYDFYAYDDQPNDNNGHGTIVAGIILDGWPGDQRLDLLNLKFYEAEGSLYDGICAIYGAVAAEADIINLSWGFYADSIPSALKDALDYAQAKDVIIVQSAGNEGLNISSDLKWPAAYRLDNMVVVGSFIRQGFGGPARIDFSNYSTDYVHMAAPFGAQSFILGGGGSQEWFSGTSVSAPIVARQLAQMRAQQPALSSRDLIQQLLTGSPQSPLLDTVVIDRKFLN